MTDNPKCELIDWEEIQQLSLRLAHLVQESDFKPDLVVAIARGGYVPARLVCDALDIYDLTSIRISHYMGAEKSEKTRLSSPLAVDVSDKRVLVVDDVTDSGDTLRLALNHINRFNPATIKVGVLHHKTTSTYEPDFYAEKVDRWRWLIYPWAIHEDIGGFINKMDPKPLSTEEAELRLQQEHGLAPSRAILNEILFK